MKKKKREFFPIFDEGKETMTNIKEEVKLEKRTQAYVKGYLKGCKETKQKMIEIIREFPFKEYTDFEIGRIMRKDILKQVEKT